MLARTLAGVAAHMQAPATVSYSTSEIEAASAGR